MGTKRYEFYDPKLSDEYRVLKEEGFCQKYFGTSRSGLRKYLDRIKRDFGEIASDEILFKIFRMRGLCKVNSEISNSLFMSKLFSEFSKLVLERRVLKEKASRVDDLEKEVERLKNLVVELEEKVNGPKPVEVEDKDKALHDDGWSPY